MSWWTVFIIKTNRVDYNIFYLKMKHKSWSELYWISNSLHKSIRSQCQCIYTNLFIFHYYKCAHLYPIWSLLKLRYPIHVNFVNAIYKCHFLSPISLFVKQNFKMIFFEKVRTLYLLYYFFSWLWCRRLFETRISPWR